MRSAGTMRTSEFNRSALALKHFVASAVIALLSGYVLTLTGASYAQESACQEQKREPEVTAQFRIPGAKAVSPLCPATAVQNLADVRRMLLNAPESWTAVAGQRGDTALAPGTGQDPRLSGYEPELKQNDPLCGFYPLRAVAAARGDEIVLRTVANGDIRLSAFQGRIVLLHFWWSECNVCRRTFRNFAQLRKEYHSDDLALIGVAVDLDPRIVEQVARAHEMTWPQCANGDGLISRIHERYSLSVSNLSLPRCWILDRGGRLRFSVHPKLAEKMIEHLLQEESSAQ